VVWWSILIKLWWYVGVFQLNFLIWWSISIKLWWYGGVWKYSNIPTKFNVNTPTYNQSLIEILHQTTKTLVVCWSISINLWWYVGVFPLNFGGMVQYFH
jgi:hypothetical protein